MNGLVLIPSTLLQYIQINEAEVKKTVKPFGCDLAKAGKGVLADQHELGQ